jgi:hypothetical protein
MKAIKPVFSIYKTVVLGQLPRTFLELKNEIEKSRMDCLDDLETMMSNPAFYVSPTRTEVDTVLVSGNDLLCMGNWVQIEDVISQALECGLELCPPELGPALFLQHRSVGWRTIMMKLINGYVFDLTSCKEDLNPSTDGWSRDEKPLFQEDNYGPEIPLLTRTELSGGTTGYTKNLVFVRPRVAWW